MRSPLLKYHVDVMVAYKRILSAYQSSTVQYRKVIATTLGGTPRKKYSVNNIPQGLAEGGGPVVRFEWQVLSRVFCPGHLKGLQ
eukprot:6484690-Amphidinium_carterae.1